MGLPRVQIEEVTRSLPCLILVILQTCPLFMFIGIMIIGLDFIKAPFDSTRDVSKA